MSSSHWPARIQNRIGIPAVVSRTNHPSRLNSWKSLATEKHRMTRDQLQALSRKDLSEIARRAGIDGWHGMRKEDLVEILLRRRVKPVRASKPAVKEPAKGKAAKVAVANGTAKPGVNGAHAKRQNDTARPIASRSPR